MRASRMKSRGLSGRLAVALVTLLLAIPVVQGCTVLERFIDDEPASLDDAPSVESRGADWPVLPREGGEDGYDDPFEERESASSSTSMARSTFSSSSLWRSSIAASCRPMRGTRSAAPSPIWPSPTVAANHLLQLEGATAPAPAWAASRGQQHRRCGRALRRRNRSRPGGRRHGLRPDAPPLWRRRRALISCCPSSAPRQCAMPWASASTALLDPRSAT